MLNLFKFPKSQKEGYKWNFLESMLETHSKKSSKVSQYKTSFLTRTKKLPHEGLKYT